ncbi:molybdopterin-binding protein [Pseudorhodoplanes sp.]|uniref:molybdopterin-binding protein n=1 Tax=Pseudorhodoplanes sp. TaxID=1934341 RepID=UPI00391BA80A
MNVDTIPSQRIGRLTALAGIRAMIDAIDAVAPREIALDEARYCVLAADIRTDRPQPPVALALRDGWAVDSEATRDAGPYAPLALQPPPCRVDALAAIPPGTDAVAPLDAVTALGGMLQVVAGVAPGEGVLPAGGDTPAGAALLTAGARLRDTDLAVLAAMGIATVKARRPRICLVNARPGDIALEAAMRLLAHVLDLAGASVATGSQLDDALRRADSDAVIGIGGTGEGRGDTSVIALARAGDVACHGIGLSPGETAAFGKVDGRPVLLIPGRLDAVLACWLVLGRPLLDRLSAAEPEAGALQAVLATKVTSTIGVAEVVPLRRKGDTVEPLAIGYLRLQALAGADGWILVPPESEGYPAGTVVEMRPVP